MPNMTIADVRQIAINSGFSYAEFCVEQEATQIGCDAAAPLFAELARIDAENFAGMPNVPDLAAL